MRGNIHEKLGYGAIPLFLFLLCAFFGRDVFTVITGYVGIAACLIYLASVLWTAQTAPRGERD
ncbi:hypothetical protein [Microbacterium sp. K24]|uniref:hypothetical protein n=1 Tax=Microbacterium sp. K24 TaxID=2305446 RepID=UPI00109C3E8C|nr:hypothetical protein [Microbacterium sp. K24]